MDLTAVVRNIPTLTGAFRTELMALFAKHFNEQSFNEESCYEDDLLYWQAAFLEASLIKETLDRDSGADWKTAFSYATHKECLRCKNIDFDAILTAFSITLT